MLRALSTASSGMQAQQTRLDVTANNIANVGTSGFKRSDVQFADLLYQTQRGAGVATSQGTKTPVATQVGLGVRVIGTAKSQTIGDMKVTDGALDMAIEGRGFFAVKTGSGDAPSYTRAGSFHKDAEGFIVTSDGHRLETDVVIPSDADNIYIGADGTVTAKVSTQTQLLELGKIELATFANPAGLESMGRNLLRASASSGEVQMVTPGEAGTGNIAQGMLEMSNVQVVKEMVDLITGQRAYEVNSRVVRAADEMLQQAANLR